MQDILSMLEGMKRPRLLMRAARHGANDYQRDVHLPRLLGYGNLPGTGAALLRLLEVESSINEQRIDQDSNYSLLRHIDLMIAIVGECRMLKSARKAGDVTL